MLSIVPLPFLLAFAPFFLAPIENGKGELGFGMWQQKEKDFLVESLCSRSDISFVCSETRVQCGSRPTLNSSLVPVRNEFLFTLPEAKLLLEYPNLFLGLSSV